MSTSFKVSIRTKYTGKDEKILTVSHYPANNSPALLITSLEGEPLLTASVCMDIPPRKNHIIIKDWSENEGIQEALISANLIGPAVAYHPTGFVVATEHKMLGDLLNAWETHRNEHLSDR